MGDSIFLCLLQRDSANVAALPDTNTASMIQAQHFPVTTPKITFKKTYPLPTLTPTHKSIHHPSSLLSIFYNILMNPILYCFSVGMVCAFVTNDLIREKSSADENYGMIPKLKTNMESLNTFKKDTFTVSGGQVHMHMLL